MHLARTRTILTASFLIIMAMTCPAAGQECDDPINIAALFVECLLDGQITEAMDMLDQTMIAAIGSDLEQIAAQILNSFGRLEKVETWNSEIWRNEDGATYQILTVNGTFERGNCIMRLTFDSSLKISGFFLNPGQLDFGDDYVLPDNLVELPVTVDAGQGFPLDGLLTLPKDGPILAAVLLIHGSGPNDLDETVGSNKPFRDLAHALAAQGIACLRYSKRTNTYGLEIAFSSDFDRFDLEQEVIWDALAAIDLLKHTDGINPDAIFLLGHSMGGGLLSYLDSLGAGCRAYVILAGTSRPIWELMAEQNLVVAQELEESGELDSAEQIRGIVTQELGKARLVAALSVEEVMQFEDRIFGQSAWYMYGFSRIDPIALHLEDQKPVLIIQAEKDRQVTPVDFELWQQKMSAHPNVFFAEFGGLNHLFGAYPGDPVPFTQLVSVEYAQKTPVATEVTDFIADWILANLP